MSQKYYAAEPIWLTLSGNQGRLSYWVVVRNIMRMLLMSKEDVDAETALEMLDEMPMDEFDRLKRRAAAEYADRLLYLIQIGGNEHLEYRLFFGIAKVVF